MDFDLNDDQRLLKDSVDRLIADKYGFEQRRGFMAEEAGWSRAMWAQFAELGLLGLPFSEELGGFGGGPVETMIVAEAFGRGLVLEPYFATVVLGGGLIRRAADRQRRRSCCRRSRPGTSCWRSPMSSGSPATSCTTWRRSRATKAGGGGWKARRASCCTAT